MYIDWEELIMIIVLYKCEIFLPQNLTLTDQKYKLIPVLYI